MALPKQSTIPIKKNKKTQQIEAGLYQANSHELVPLIDCLVQEPQTQKVMNTVVELLNKYDLPIYDERSNSGIFRTIMVRVGIKTGELQVVFITRSQKFPQKMQSSVTLTNNCQRLFQSCKMFNLLKLLS